MALKMAARLRLVEAELRNRGQGPSAVTLFWHDELAPCLEHPRCRVEIATDLHHSNVIVLTWERAE